MIKTFKSHKAELPKFFCIAAMIFLVVYILNVLRISKDALVISLLGAEAISALKLWVVLPCSIVCILAYIKASDKLSRSTLFHILNWIFVTYFVIFTLFLYPNRELLQIHINPELTAKLPMFKYLFAVISHWYCSLYFFFAEMFSTIMFSISFWQLANHVTTMEEAKTTYPVLGFVSNFGLMLAGYLSKIFAAHSDTWQPALNKTTISIIIAGALLSLCLSALSKIIGPNTLNKRNESKFAKSLGKIKKMTIIDSLKYIALSKPILAITTILFCFNMSLNIAEGIWKKALEIYFSNNASDIQYFEGNVNFYRSILGMVFSVISIWIMKRYTWKTSALITPIVILIVGGICFLSLSLKDSQIFALTAIPALSIAVYFGAINNTVTKALKYTLLDSTKEMMYINLDDELQSKGKAAAETFGIKVGKGGGSFVQQTLLAMFAGSTLLDLAPFISIIFFLTLAFWIFSVIKYETTH